MKYKYSRKEFLKKVGFLFSKGKILVPNEVDGEELMKLLLAQKEDKKEWKPCDCPKGGIDGDGMVCDKCGGTEWVKVKSTTSPLELPKKLITVDNCAGLTQFTLEQEFKDWIKQVTNSLNTIIKK